MMTHGDRNGKLFVKDGDISVDTLWKYFTGDRCPSLNGKPKLLFIQACRGKLIDPGALYEVDEGPTVSDSCTKKLASKGGPCGSFSPTKYVIPTLADFLIMFSSAEGYYSFLNNKEGSCFVQTLCQQFTKYLNSKHQIDLMTILTAVNRHVAFGFQSKVLNEKHDGSKQMPNIMSMLTKSVIFNMQLICDKNNEEASI